MNQENAANKAALYLRWTSTNQRDSGAEQRATLARKAASMGLEVVEVYVDAGCSGSSSKTCPQLRKLLEDARSGLFRHLLVYDLSRLSRGPQLASVVRELRNCAVMLHYDGE